MKKEKLFRALGDIGDDLLHMAEFKRFPNVWRKWISLAACLVLVMSLSLLALPYFPMGCGAGSQAPEETEAMTSTENMEAPAEPETPAEAAEPEEQKDAAGAVETPEMAESDGGVSGTTMVVYGGTYYYLDYTVALPGKTPANLGEYVGTVEDSNDESLIGCQIYATVEVTWYGNHAVQGVSVPNAVYVKTEDGYVYGRTFNEKIVSRYSAEDVREMVDDMDPQLIGLFVEPLEAQQVGELLEGAMDSEQMNRLFLATLNMNTGLSLADQWRQDQVLMVPAADVRWRLERFLDQADYDPAETGAYDPYSDCLVFSEEDLYQSAKGLTLNRASMDGNVLSLWVNLPEGDEKYYEIRFDEDSWRYVQMERKEG